MCSQQKSSSSSSSSADVDVHSAWDNYDLTLPVHRRCSDDRCSLLTHWTDSTASLKSCLSHNAVSRSFADSGSTAAESDGGAHRRRDHRQPGHRDDRCRGRSVDSTSSSKQLADGNLSPRHRDYPRKCEFAKTAVQRCRDDGTKRRQSSSFRGDAGGRPSTWSRSAARRCRRPLTVDNDNDDDDYITTSSEGDDQPSTSASSFAPSNWADDRASLLSSSTTSSSVAFTAAAPRSRSDHQCPGLTTEQSLKSPSRRFFPSPRRRKSTDQSHSSMNGIEVTFDDELERSRSSEEIVITPRYLGRGGSQSTSNPSREDDLRPVRSLFEFRSTDELRVANDFINGVWSLYSRRALYNEQQVFPNPIPLASTPSTSVLRFYYSGLEKDLGVGRDAGEVVAKYDKKSYSNVFNGNLTNEKNNQDVDDDIISNRGPNVADVVVRCQGAEALDDWNGWRKEFRPVETIGKLKHVKATISNEDDLTIYIRKSPVMFNNIPNDRQSSDIEVRERRVPLKLVDSDCGKQQENVAVSDALSPRQGDTVAVDGKSPDLFTPSPARRLADMPGFRALTAGGTNSWFARDVIQVFDALLVHSGFGEATSVADMKNIHPLTAAINDCVASERHDLKKFLQTDNNSVTTTLTKPTEDDFGSPADTVKSDKRVGLNKCRPREKTTEEFNMVRRLTPRLSTKPELSCDLVVTKSTNQTFRNAEETNAEQSSSKQPACHHDNYMAPTVSAPRNDVSDDLQSTGETRKRLSRKSRGRGKVRELIKLFESASASTLENSTSPVDVRRATISAAVSVGELLRRFSEQQVNSCDPSSRALLDDGAEQPKITSPNVVEVRSSTDVAREPRIIRDEGLSKREDGAVMHKSTARWPTMKRFRRRHCQRHIVGDETSLGDQTASWIDLDRSSKTRDSRSDPRTTSANDDGEDPARVDNILRKTSENFPMSSEKHVNQSEWRDVSIKPLEQPKSHSCEDSNITRTTSLPSAVGCNSLPVVVESANLSSVTAPLLLSSSATQGPSKSLDNYEAAATENTSIPSTGGSGDVGDYHLEDEHASSDRNKFSAAHFDGKVKPLTNHTTYGRSTPPAPVAFLREQPVAADSEIAAETKYNLTETPSPSVAKDDDCRRFTVRSWFVAGGPCQVEVPWSIVTSAKDVVATLHWSKSKARRPAKATLETEAGCPAAYPVQRVAGVTLHSLHLMNKFDVSSRKTSGENWTGSDKYAANLSFRQERRLTTQPTKNKSSSYEVQAAKRKSGRIVPKWRTDENISTQSASWRQQRETFGSDVTTKATGIDHEFDVVASTVVGSRGRGGVETMDTQKGRYRLKRDYCKSATPRPSTNRSDTSNATPASHGCLRSVKTRAQRDDLPSTRSSPDKKSDHRHLLQRQQTTHNHDATSRTKRSSIMTECGLISGESIESPDGVTVVCTRRRLTPDRSTAVTDTTSSHPSDRTQPPATDNYKKLAQHFLLASLLEYRLFDQRR